MDALNGDGRRGPGTFLAAAITLGVGLGGLIDGIVLHQVLQWHHMLSAPLPPVTVEALEMNTLADGLFHLGAWIVTLVGVIWLSRTARPPGAGRPLGAGPRLGGGMLVGWGVFNLVEGIVDHYLLGVHHVRSGPDAAAYDLAALVIAALLIAAGIILARRAPRRSRAASIGQRVRAS